MTKIASNLQIDSARLWDTIHETAKFGATAKGGVRRLTLGPEDKQVRDWFRSACEAAGLEVHVDALGSMFGLRKGRDMSKPPVGLGSHLDTQPTGGKFDGVLGTLAALEVVRTLNDAGIETETPICIVNWTNEEGSRFAPATMASAAYAGDYTTENILARTDAAGVSVGLAAVFAQPLFVQWLAEKRRRGQGLCCPFPLQRRWRAGGQSCGPPWSSVSGSAARAPTSPACPPRTRFGARRSGIWRAKARTSAW